MAEGLRTAIDKRIGRTVSRSVVAHHRRRLDRVGWLHALDARDQDWATGVPPPRRACSLEVLIDGAETFPRIAAELGKAESHVHITGWQFSPEFALTRGANPKILRNLLAEIATRVDVRVLAWAGAPLPFFQPSRGSVRDMRDRLCDGTRIHCALDARERPLHCHHEKTIVIDDRLAFVGGLDLTSEGSDRFDSDAHVARARVGWHDVSTLIHGSAVGDVAAHFHMRWNEVTDELLAAPAPTGSKAETEIQIVRTVPERIYRALPCGDFGILESYASALRSAEELIYLENQFLWSPEITTILCDKLRRPPTNRFRLLIVLPSRPNTGMDDTRGTLGELVEADADGGRLLACTLYARHGALSDPVYVHAKVGIVDDSWLTIGSANLNDHSLFNDTEMNVVTRDPAVARETRLRLWAEHLELSMADVAGDPVSVVEDHWKPVSADQLARHEAGRPLTHRLMRLPHVSRRSGRLLGPLQGLLVDG